MRIKDRGGLRVGGLAYANENESFGGTTLQRRHVRLESSTVRLKFMGKSAGRWDVTFDDNQLVNYFSATPRSPRSRPALCYLIPEEAGRKWHQITDADVNNYLTDITGQEITAKDFRTWQGTRAAANSLARSYKLGSTTPSAVSRAMEDAAAWLHRTPTVARESYVNPRVVTLLDRGEVVKLSGSLDSALLNLLAPWLVAGPVAVSE